MKPTNMDLMCSRTLNEIVMFVLSRSRGLQEEAEALLRDSIHFGPHFADAYSSLASLYAEQVEH